MKEYIAMLLCVGGLGGVFEMLCQSNGDMKRYVRLLCSLCVLCVIAAPIGSVLENIRNGEILGMQKDDLILSEEEYEETFYEYLLYCNSAAVSEYLEEELRKTFDLDSDDLEIYTELFGNGEENAISRLTVYINDPALDVDPRKLKNTLYSLTKIECEIIYK